MQISRVMSGDDMDPRLPFYIVLIAIVSVRGGSVRTVGGGNSSITVTVPLVSTERISEDGSLTRGS